MYCCIYVSLKPYENLWIPTSLVFLAGVIRYATRRSKYLASASSSHESMLTETDPGRNFSKFMDEYYLKKIARFLTQIEMLPELDRVVKAANLFKVN